MGYEHHICSLPSFLLIANSFSRSNNELWRMWEFMRQLSCGACGSSRAKWPAAYVGIHALKHPGRGSHWRLRGLLGYSHTDINLGWVIRLAHPGHGGAE